MHDLKDSNPNLTTTSDSPSEVVQTGGGIDFEEFWLDYVSEQAKKLTIEDIYFIEEFENRLKRFALKKGNFKYQIAPPLPQEILDKFHKIMERLGVTNGS